MRQNTNTIESCFNLFTDFNGNCTTCLSFYLFIGQGLRVYPKHFFFGVNTILLFAGLTCHLRPRLSCLLFRQNAKYRQDAPFSFFSKSTLNLFVRYVFGFSIHAKMRKPQEEATKLQNDKVEALTFMPSVLLSHLLTSSAAGTSSV